MNETNKNCQIRNVLFGMFYKSCLACDFSFWIFIIVWCYVVTINLTLMYGLKKTTKNFKNPQLLQFLLALTDLVVVVYYAIIYIVPFYLQDLQRDECEILMPLMQTIRSILFVFEPFILGLIIFCRYITICYPFQNNKLSHFVNSKQFIIILLAAFTLGCILCATCMTLLKLSDTIHFVSIVTYNLVCFLWMAVLNTGLILKLRNNCNLKSENMRSITKQMRAVKTLIMMMVTMICCNTPYLLVLIAHTIQSLGNDYNLLKLLLDYIEFISAINMLGMGINSNILLCRNAEVIKLLKKKSKALRPVK